MPDFNEKVYRHKEEGKRWEHFDKHRGSTSDQRLLANVEFYVLHPYIIIRSIITCYFRRWHLIPRFYNRKLCSHLVTVVPPA